MDELKTPAKGGREKDAILGVRLGAGGRSYMVQDKKIGVLRNVHGGVQVSVGDAHMICAFEEHLVTNDTPGVAASPYMQQQLSMPMSETSLTANRTPASASRARSQSDAAGSACTATLHRAVPRHRSCC